MTKEVYTKPTLRTHGHVESLTKGQSTGNFLDADFPQNTPFGQLTFS